MEVQIVFADSGLATKASDHLLFDTIMHGGIRYSPWFVIYSSTVSWSGSFASLHKYLKIPEEFFARYLKFPLNFHFNFTVIV